MPNLPLYYNVPGSRVPIKDVFLNVNGVAVDPDTVTLVLTDPANASTTYTYVSGGVDPGAIIKDSTGSYHFQYEVTSDTIPGLWNFVWVGTGGGVVNGVQVNTGSQRIFSMEGEAAHNRTYVSPEELKSSINVSQSETKDDYEIQRACITATSLIHDLCGQHFYQITEPRTFSYDSIYELFIDAVVPGSITEFALDYSGTGVYDTIWTENRDFQTLRFNERYNVRWLGEERPHDFVRVLLSVNGAGGAPGGQMLPFVWAYTPNNRVRITATWGWPEVPQNIHHAAVLLATDLFKMKDAPWGIAGMGELGMVKTQANPEVTELIARYREPRNIVGV